MPVAKTNPSQALAQMRAKPEALETKADESFLSVIRTDLLQAHGAIRAKLEHIVTEKSTIKILKAAIHQKNLREALPLVLGVQTRIKIKKLLTFATNKIKKTTNKVEFAITAIAAIAFAITAIAAIAAIAFAITVIMGFAAEPIAAIAAIAAEPIATISKKRHHWQELETAQRDGGF